MTCREFRSKWRGDCLMCKRNLNTLKIKKSKGWGRITESVATHIKAMASASPRWHIQWHIWNGTSTSHVYLNSVILWAPSSGIPQNTGLISRSTITGMSISLTLVLVCPLSFSAILYTRYSSSTWCWTHRLPVHSFLHCTMGLQYVRDAPSIAYVERSQST